LEYWQVQRKKNLVGNQLRVLLFLLASECMLLLLSLIVDKIGKFHTNMEIHSRSTSSQHDLHVPFYNLTDYQKGVFCAGIQLFNVLTYNIKIFKHDIRVLQPTLKGYLHSHPFYCVVEFASIDGL
jgi:hypothetical protein